MRSKLVRVVCPAHQLNSESIIVFPRFREGKCELGRGSIEVNQWDERIVKLISDFYESFENERLTGGGTPGRFRTRGVVHLLILHQ